MARMKKTDPTPIEGLREHLQVANADKVARYGAMPGNPYVRFAADLAAGRPVIVSGWQIPGMVGDDRNGHYAVDAAGNVTPSPISPD